VKTLLSAALVLLAVSAAVAGENPVTAIQDNSFLIEEAYNQEEGVVQHISFFNRDRRTGEWLYTFTQEWPVQSQKHQFSYTVPMTGGTDQRIGDVMLNYRYQLIGTGETRTAVAPRFSVIVPSGGGSSGVQVALPVSRVVASRVVAHSNVGATWLRDTHDIDFAAGQSFIYALNSTIHPMLEATWTRTQGETEVLISPGVRWAHNLGGLQIVPGIAMPIGAGPSAGKRSVVLYLSFEQ
jgi:hypothetical protein